LPARTLSLIVSATKEQSVAQIAPPFATARRVTEALEKAGLSGSRQEEAIAICLEP